MSLKTCIGTVLGTTALALSGGTALAPATASASRGGPLQTDSVVHVLQDKAAIPTRAQMHAATTPAPAAEAQSTWNSIVRHDGNPTGQALRDHPSGPSASAWTYGQTMAGAEDLGYLTHDYSLFQSMDTHLSRYQTSHGYASATNGVHGIDAVYSDDNAWLGLGMMQAYHDTGDPHYLNQAEGVFNTLDQARRPAGLPWDLSAPSTYNTCDEGPAVELALQLHLATTQAAGQNPATTSTRYLTFAKQVYDNVIQQQMQQERELSGHIHDLRRTHQHVPRVLTSQLHSLQSGLFGDHVDIGGPPAFTSRGLVGANPSSYDEGTMIGANTLFYRTTGNPMYLHRAKKLAELTMHRLPTPAEAHHDNPAFFNILARNLDQLNAVAPNPKYQSYLDRYGTWAWHTARNPRSGEFDRHIAAYDDVRDGTIDQAAMTQFFADQARVQASPSAGSALT